MLTVRDCLEQLIQDSGNCQAFSNFAASGLAKSQKFFKIENLKLTFVAMVDSRLLKSS